MHGTLKSTMYITLAIAGHQPFTVSSFANHHKPLFINFIYVKSKLYRLSFGSYILYSAHQLYDRSYAVRIVSVSFIFCLVHAKRGCQTINGTYSVYNNKETRHQEKMTKQAPTEYCPKPQKAKGTKKGRRVELQTNQHVAPGFRALERCESLQVPPIDTTLH